MIGALRWRCVRNILISTAITLAGICFVSCGSSSSSSPQVDVSTIDGATEVAVDSSFVYNFSSDVDSDTISASTFFVFPTAMVSANISKAAYDATVCNSSLALAAPITCETGKLCKLIPQHNLSSNTRYTICLSTDIHYDSGNAFEGFISTFTTATAAYACELSLSFAGPSTPFTFQSLGEDPVKCAMTSWREYFSSSEPDSSAIFVSSNCGQETSGSLNKPYCNISEALVSAADFFSHEITPELYIDPGEYVMNLNLKSELADMKIFGLCSRTTTILPSDSETPLIKQDGTVNVFLRVLNVTLKAGNTAVIELSNGDIFLNQVEVVQGAENVCFSIAGSISTLTGEDVIISGSATSSSSSTQTSVDEGSLMYVVHNEDLEKCITVENGGTLIMEDFSISNIQGIGVYVTGSNSSATLSSGTVSEIAERSGSDGLFGYGIAVEDSARASLNRVTLTDNGGANLFVDGDGTSATITNSYISNSKTNPYSGTGVGMILQRGSSGNISFSNFIDNESVGLVVSPGSEAVISDSSFSGNTFANVVITNANATLSQNSIGTAIFHPARGGGVGLFIQGRNADAQTTAQILNNIISDSVYQGIYVVEQSSGSMDLTIEDNYIHNNATSNTSLNSSFLIYQSPGVINLQDNCIASGGTIEPAMIIDGSTTNVSSSGNIIIGTYDTYAIDQQRCGSPPDYVVDASTFELPLLSVNCECGINSSTGGSCVVPLGLPAYFYFGISEVEAVQ